MEVKTVLVAVKTVVVKVEVGTRTTARRNRKNEGEE